MNCCLSIIKNFIELYDLGKHVYEIFRSIPAYTVNSEKKHSANFSHFQKV